MRPQERTSSSMKHLRQECQELAKTDPGDVHKMAALHSEMILDYYQDVRQQAQQSFLAAIVAAMVGTMFFLISACFMMQRNDVAHISLIAGGLVQVISAINFFLYSQTSRQFASFHICLERTNRFLLSHSISEHLNGEIKNTVRTELIRTIAQAPMLTLIEVNKDKSQAQ